MTEVTYLICVRARVVHDNSGFGARIEIGLTSYTSECWLFSTKLKLK